MNADPAQPTRASTVRAGHLGDLPTLVRAARAGDPAVRAAALGGLVRSDALDRELLTAAVGDPAPEVRRRAAGVLGSPAGAALDPGAGLLLELLDDDDPDVADWACWAAGERLGDTDALVGPLASMATSHPEPIVREGAVAALGSLGHEDGRQAVVAACDDVATVRRRAVLALVAFDGRAVTEALERLSGDRDWQVRQAAEELLAIGDGEDGTPEPTAQGT